MALSPGNQLGPYEVVAPLGAGGMGEVYRARDTRLNRDVAVKVLPASFAADPARLRRFELEARATGMLNHPNILAVYDIGSHEGTPYLVTELLEGRTLRQQMPVSRRKALEYARQTCQGLAAAHAKEITHRDLKPENLFITNDGRVKILDFGLAKLALSEEETRTAGAATLPGTPMGTASYMSPEQVRGLPADQRSDIFSLGIVLYEMLSERRPFQRETAAESMTAILKDDPPLEHLPSGLARTIEHCLEKNPEERFQSARDVAFALEDLSGSGPQVPVSSRVQMPIARIATAVLVLVALGVAFQAGRGFGTRPTTGEVRVERLTDFPGLEEDPALSPDGKSLAFVAEKDGKRQIWVRLLSGGPALQVTQDAADHQYPRWAPDSGSLIYYAPPVGSETEGTISQVSALGGAPRRLAGGIGGADISHDGKRLTLFQFQNGRVKLVVLSSDGSMLREVVQLEPGFIYLCPRWSPDDRWIAFEKGIDFLYDIHVAPAEGGKSRAVTNDGIIMKGLSWLRDSSGLVYSSARNSPQLYLQTFDLWQIGLKGEDRRQLTFGGNSWVDPDVGVHGEVVAGRVSSQVNLWKYPVGGKPPDNVRRGIQITGQTGVVLTPSVSPQDKEVVYLSDSGGHSNLWVSNLATGQARQITFENDPGVKLGVPVWSPDGRYIVFVSTRGNRGWDVGLWLVRPDGSGLRVLVQDGAGFAAWSPDSRWVYSIVGPRGGLASSLIKIPVEGGAPVAVRTGIATRAAPAPDGHTLYYVEELARDRGGADMEIRVANPEGAQGKALARISAAQVPDWSFFHPVISPDGKWLALSRNDGLTNNLWTVSTADGSFHQITEFQPRRVSIARRVSWSSDGRFLFAAVAESESDVVLLTGLKY